MDQIPTQTLAQYGAVGVVAAIMVGLVVLIFKQLITHILTQNEKHQEQQQENQAKTLESLHAIGQALQNLNNSINRFQADTRRDIVEMVREEVTVAGSRAHRTRPRDPRDG